MYLNVVVFVVFNLMFCQHYEREHGCECVDVKNACTRNKRYKMFLFIFYFFIFCQVKKKTGDVNRERHTNECNTNREKYFSLKIEGKQNKRKNNKIYMTNKQTKCE